MRTRIYVPVAEEGLGKAFVELGQYAPSFGRYVAAARLYAGSNRLEAAERALGEAAKVALLVDQPLNAAELRRARELLLEVRASARE